MPNKKCSPCDLNNALKYAKRSVELLERLQKNKMDPDVSAEESLDRVKDIPSASGAVTPLSRQRPFMPLEPAPEIWAPKEYHGIKLVIMSTLGDFQPSYSLTTVILDQVQAALLAGFDVHLVGMAGARKEQISCEIRDNEHLTIHCDRADEPDPGLPQVHWKEDEIDDEKTSTLSHWLMKFLAHVDPDIIITHDLLFQSWHLTMARAIHTMSDPSDGVRWFHQAHSCTGARPEEDRVADYRASIPDGHSLLAENYAEIPYLCDYYQVAADRIRTLSNIRDCRDFLGLSKDLSTFVSTHQIHRADICQIYPLSTPRAEAKGVSKVLDVFGALKAKGKTVRLILANAHGNGEDPERVMRELKAHARAVGLVNGVEVLWTSEEIPGTLVYGLSKNDIRGLFELSNIFLFPSHSEACGLVMLEAAMTGNLLFLNSDIPTMTDFFPHGDAYFVAWGSMRNPHGINASALGAEVADMVMGALAKNMLCKAKRRLLQQFSLESMAQGMYELWSVESLAKKVS